ncbi:MAG: tRNA (guanosine(46)-N7)-methyltransferase TrmB, partial [Spirochaetales bacterium]
MADWKIRSYVLRSVKLPVTYRKVLEEFGSRYCVPFCGNGVRFEEIFGNNRQVFAEIGFGAGDFLFSTAVRRSFDNFIGLEVFLQGLGKLVYRLHEKGITNVRVINEDAALVFAGMIPAESLSGIHIMFPDPWPKKKHKKRRLLTAEFASLLLASLVPGGYI